MYPTQLNNLAVHPGTNKEDLKSVKDVLVGGSVLNLDMAVKFKQFLSENVKIRTGKYY